MGCLQSFPTAGGGGLGSWHNEALWLRSQLVDSKKGRAVGSTAHPVVHTHAHAAMALTCAPLVVSAPVCLGKGDTVAYTHARAGGLAARVRFNSYTFVYSLSMDVVEW